MMCSALGSYWQVVFGLDLGFTRFPAGRYTCSLLGFHVSETNKALLYKSYIELDPK